MISSAFNYALAPSTPRSEERVSADADLGATNRTLLTRTFTVTSQNGLHARPCAMLVKTLRPFRSEVRVEAHGVTTSARSIMGLMALAVGGGSKIKFIAKGEDAGSTLDAVGKLFASRFSEVPMATTNSQFYASNH